MKRANFLHTALQDFKMIRGLVILNLLLGCLLLGNFLMNEWYEPEGDPDQISMVGCFSGGSPVYMDKALGPVKVSDDNKSITFMSENRKVKVSVLNGTCLILPEKAEK